MQQRTLVNLVAKAKAGDQAAFEELRTRFLPLIRACGRGLPAVDRQDLEQELSIQLSRLVQGYRVLE